MKALLSLIISGALVVSGYSQTRNVLVGTNNAVVQPTNFWSADASNARVGLGLGSAATNPASAFQPSSITLSNLAVSNGVALTNLTASNIVGTLSIVQGGTGATNASAARTFLGLDTAATNPASAFQTSSINLSNLAASNGGSLTNLQATSLVGIIPASNISTVNFTNIGGTLSVVSGGTGATNAANARQNLGSTTVGDALFIATNDSVARAIIGATTVGSSIFTLANPSAITFLRLNADNTASALSASSFRTALSLGTAATNPATAFQAASVNLANLSTNNGANLTNIPVAGVVGALTTNGDGSGLTNITAANITGTVALASNVAGTIAISNGGSGATNAGGARTNLGLGATNSVAFNSVAIGDGDLQFSNDSILWSGTIRYSPEDQSFEGNIGINNGFLQFIGTNAVVNAATTRTNLGLGATWLTNTNVTNFRTAIGLGTLGSVSFEEVFVSNAFEIAGGAPSGIQIDADGIQFGATNAAATRTNLGLGWPALTNSNAGIGLVSVSTNGEVVSPTNFWQVAPIQTLVQDFTLIGGTQTNNATNARNLYVYSLNTNLGGVSNTIILPTNAATFAGDEVTVIHRGTTNTTTVIRQAGSTNNLITLSRFDESVKFIRELGQWDFYHNISHVEPIQFSGTNAAANAAASRTNLGLGASSDVYFQSAIFGTNIASSIVSIDNFGISIESSDTNTSVSAISFIGAATDRMAANTRTNLGLPLAALTNTNNANFQAAIFATNAAPTNTATPNTVNFTTAIHWMEVNVVTNGVTNNFRIPLFK